MSSGGKITSADRYRQEATDSNSIKVRLSDGVCQILAIEPDHVITPFPSTTAHQTLTNYCIRGKALLKCI